jgi:peptidoglycan L-alanyl-D-glutamate endopeptidase CwlK
MSLDLKSTRFLDGVHPDLVSVIERASEAIPFRVTEGLRTKQRQAELVKQGKSRTMNSRHLTGHAIDFVDPKGSYDAAEMTKIADAIKQASNDLGVAVVWGGDWTTFRDTPHVELEAHAYPASSFAARAKAVIGGAAGGGLVIPAVPSVLTDNAANASNWQAAGDQIAGLAKWAIASPLALLVIAATAALLFLPKLVGGRT